MSRLTELKMTNRVKHPLRTNRAKGNLWLALSGLMAFVIMAAGCGGDGTVGSAGDDRVEISEDVFSVDEHPGVSLVGIQGSIYTFKFSGPKPGIRNGEVIVGSDGAGYLRRVAAVEWRGDSLVVDTNPARLTDAIVNGNMSDAVTIDPRLLRDHGGQSASRITAGATGGIDLSGLTLISDTIDGVDVDIVISEGLFVFKPRLSLDLNIRDRDLDELSMMMSGDLRFDCTIEANASGTISCSAETTFVSVTDTVVQFIGPVPVIEIVRLDFVAGCEMSAADRAACRFACEGDYDLTVGAEYKREQWTEIWHRTQELRGEPVIRAGSVDMEANVYVRPRLSVAFYAISETFIECEPFVTVTYDASKSTSCEWELSAGISGALGFEVDVLGYYVDRFAEELPEYTEALRTDRETCECTWTKAPGVNPVVDVGDGASHDERHAHVSCVVKAGQQYFMYYLGTPVWETNHKYVMLATSPDGVTWTKHGTGDEPLDFGITGYHEIMGISVLYDQEESPPFKAWYAKALVSGYSRIDIFYATSDDGISWDTETVGNPVVTRGTGWEDFRVQWPCVRRDAGVYHMWYEGSTEHAGGGIGHATSTNGLDWVKDQANPVISPQKNSPWVVLADGIYYLYTGAPSGIVRATSADGSLWDTSGFDVPVLPLGKPGSWDALRVHRLAVMEDGGILKGWYAGWNGPECRTGYATCEMP